jgi:hypothetical protein
MDEPQHEQRTWSDVGHPGRDVSGPMDGQCKAGARPYCRGGDGVHPRARDLKRWTKRFGNVPSSLLYGVSRFDPVTLAGGVVVFLAVATVATLVPAVRASRIPPAKHYHTDDRLSDGRDARGAYRSSSRISTRGNPLRTDDVSAAL